MGPFLLSLHAFGQVIDHVEVGFDGHVNVGALNLDYHLGAIMQGGAVDLANGDRVVTHAVGPALLTPVALGQGSQDSTRAQGDEQIPDEAELRDAMQRFFDSETTSSRSWTER